MMASAPANKIERAHLMYREGRYDAALEFYTEALSAARTKPQKIALHSNRAACFLKLNDFKKAEEGESSDNGAISFPRKMRLVLYEVYKNFGFRLLLLESLRFIRLIHMIESFQAAEECTSVLELDYNHTGALMLRAQTLVTLREYRSALFDVNRLIELNPSSEVYQNLEARLRTQVSLAPIPESEAELEEEEEDEDEEESDRYGEKEEQYIGNEDIVPSGAGRDQLAEANKTIVAGVVIPLKKPTSRDSTEHGRDQTETSLKTTSPAEVVTPESIKVSLEKEKGWQSIPKPKGHSSLDYGRWDSVEDDSSEDDDDDDEEESQPQYRFRVKTVGVRPVK